MAFELNLAWATIKHEEMGGVPPPRGKKRGSWVALYGGRYPLEPNVLMFDGGTPPPGKKKGSWVALYGGRYPLEPHVLSLDGGTPPPSPPGGGLGVQVHPGNSARQENSI